MAYATIAEFKASSKLADTTRDALIQMCLDAASAAIDGFCNREDGFVATAPIARTFASIGRDVVSCDECMTVTLVEEYGNGVWVALTADDWVAFSGDIDQPDYDPPFSAIMRVDGTFPSGKLARVRITAEWGVSESAPPMVKTACIAQATKWFKRGEGSWANSIANNNMGRRSFVQALDSEVEFMLVSARLVRPAI